MKRAWIWSAFGVSSLAGLVLIVASAVRHSDAPTHGELAADPMQFVPTVHDLPNGTRLYSHRYISTESAAKNNGTPLALLRRVGREIGYDRDFVVPAYGDIEIEVVRYKTHQGLSEAYDYFLKLPQRQGLRAVPMSRLGEKAALVVGNSVVFIEFRRERYYVVVTAVPATGASVNFITQVSKNVDRRIREYRASA
jgi:hypothetical protein